MIKKPYRGKLARPIVRRRSPTFKGAVTAKRVAEFRRDHDQHQAEADRFQRDQEAEKLTLLMQHYGIGKSDFRSLALELARAHVPGFEIKIEGERGAGGRKKKWDGPKLQALASVVNEVKLGQHLNDRRALRHISTKQPYCKQWSAPADHKGTKEQWVETLESRLNDARKYIQFLDNLLVFLENRKKKFRKL